MAKDQFTKAWILKYGIPIVKSYNGNLTLRALHYRLVAAGMFNTQNHYKRVVQTMIDARWEGSINFDDFLDHERDVEGETKWKETVLDDKVAEAKNQVGLWMRSYRKNRWENQLYYPEVFIEKKALQGVFDKPCRDMNVALCPCKGYPSLTYLHQASARFQEATNQGKKPLMLYFGDYDPSGEDIPRSIKANIERMGVEIEVKRIALMEDQVVKWKLPPAPTKDSDTRSATWEGLGQVELDAVEPKALVKLVKDAIADYFDEDLYAELEKTEEDERAKYVKQLKAHVKTL